MKQNDIELLREETKQLRVLYVEDDEITRMQFNPLFEMLFKELTTAVDGIDALEKYETTEYDLVITDINMPRMDGIELSKKIREIKPAQKIIIVSAHDTSDFLLAAIGSNVDSFILKPIETEQLYASLYKVAFAIKSERIHTNYYKMLEENVAKKTKLLAQQVVTDDLTGLPNRKALMQYLEQEGKCICALLNIDNFKMINVAYGYKHGDVFIKCTANFLREATLPYPFIKLYYLGVDEFALVFEKSELSKVYEFIMNLSQQIGSSLMCVDPFTIKTSASIAITMEGKDFLRNAHIALREARMRGRSRIEVYHHESPTELMQIKIKNVLPLLKQAVDKKRIIPYFQPIVDVRTQEILKYEALARMIDDKGAVFPPANFIDVAELTGMIPEITRLMIDQTLKILQNNHFHVSLNISESDLNDSGFIDFMMEKVSRYDIDPSRVVLEVLENVSVDAVTNSIEQIEKLQKRGFKISIDDFGTQNSNFGRVHGMNVDFIKIDGSFIRDIDTNPKSYSVVKSITEFAHSIDAKVIAEFVHSKNVFDIVSELGIEYAQGHYIAEAKDIVEMYGRG
jgi:diguanylate cyclase